MTATAVHQHARTPVRFDPVRLRAARHVAGLSLRAAGAHLGYHWVTVQRYELGAIDPPTSVLAALAELYGVHPGDLFSI